jgi:hypothetical protein
MLTERSGKKRNKILIINRTFWPENDILGSALLKSALALSHKNNIYIQSISESKVSEQVKEKFGDNALRFFSLKGSSDSNRSFSYRVTQSLLFSIYTIYSLLTIKPDKVYISSDPPIVVPFIVTLLSRVLKIKVIYHLQDIHPEAADLVIKMNPVVKRMLRFIDSFSLKHASKIIVISTNMKNTILRMIDRPDDTFYIIDNCSPKVISLEEKKPEIVFCGNLGRFQKINYIMEEFSDYYDEGGSLCSSFIGGGVNLKLVNDISNKYSLMKAYGRLPFNDASKIMNEKQWAILAIDSEVLKYAYPSKIASYLMHGCNIIFLTDNEDDFLELNSKITCGVTCTAKKGELKQLLIDIEKGKYVYTPIDKTMINNYTENSFIDKLTSVLEND